MARTGKTAPPPRERIVDIDVAEEMQGSFLEYAYSVIYSRALPDARDGLKPVQRRILFQMAQMGLRPDRGHVKSARVVGEVMGRLHPHGDSAIYDALVRMAQPFSLRLPMVDGHGNFGSPDDGPAAMRYTECRLAAPALDMTASLDEDVVDFLPNYDGRETEPTVLPAAIPSLLVNGAAGIAVGMATNMAPHNLGEVIAAARHLLDHPDAGVADLVRFVPGPDLPTGGIITGLDGVRQAYETGKGSFRMRATTGIEQITARRQGIVVTSLPYSVGPERVVERIRDLVRDKKLTGIANLTDLTDADHGLRLVIEVKSGFNPTAVQTQLFKLTPLEEQFSINNVALVGGQPQTLGLKGLLRVFLDHRLDVVTRRSTYRRERAAERLHLVAGLLIAILDIDEVIAIVRGSDDTAMARHRLIAAFELSEAQANYILEMPLRRLTKFSRLELEAESDELRKRIDALTRILDDPAELRRVVSQELADVAARHADERRTILLEAADTPQPATPLEVPDGPCWVLMSNTGLVARTSSSEPPAAEGRRARHDCVVAAAPSTTRSKIGVLTSDGKVHMIAVVDLPALPDSASAPVLSGGSPLGALLDLPRDVRAVGLAPVGATVALGTRQGVVKRVVVEDPGAKSEWELIRLADRDAVIGAGVAADGPGQHHLVFISRDAQLLRFPPDAVRPQGRAAAGMAGIRLAAADEALFFGVVDCERDGAVVTVAGDSAALPGTSPGTAKVTPLTLYPAKGRGTGGVRCHRFRAGEDRLLFAWAGAAPVRAAAASGAPVVLPDPDPRRDGTGTPLATPVAGTGGPVR
jgi:DNA gyrase subunit A